LKKVGIVLFSLLGLAIILSVLDFGITGMYHTQEHPFMNRYCQDTDRGYDYYFKGTTGYPNSYMKEDKCLRTNYLQEYFCFRNRLRWQRTLCPKGYVCNDGACITTSEYDTWTSKHFVNYHAQWVNQTNRTQPFIYDRWKGIDYPRKGIFQQRFNYPYWSSNRPDWY